MLHLARSSPAYAVWRLMYPVSLRLLAHVRGRAVLPRRPSCFPIASTPYTAVWPGAAEFRDKRAQNPCGQRAIRQEIQRVRRDILRLPR